MFLIRLWILSHSSFLLAAVEIWPDRNFPKLMESRLEWQHADILNRLLLGYVVINDLENRTENMLTKLADQVNWVWWG